MKSPPTKLLLAAAVGAAVIGIPVAWASHTFTDVPTSSPHHADISYLADLGITSGCAPGLYCPDDPVRRDQMASFLARTIRLTTVVLSDEPENFGIVDSWVEVDSISVATNRARLLIEFSAVTDCRGIGPTCPLRVLGDGTEVGSIENFDQFPGFGISQPDYRGFAAVTDALSDGSHTVTVEVFTTNGTGFTFENRLLKVTAF